MSQSYYLLTENATLVAAAIHSGRASSPWHKTTMPYILVNHRKHLQPTQKVRSREHGAICAARVISGVAAAVPPPIPKRFESCPVVPLGFVLRRGKRERRSFGAVHCSVLIMTDNCQRVAGHGSIAITIKACFELTTQVPVGCSNTYKMPSSFGWLHHSPGKSQQPAAFGLQALPGVEGVGSIGCPK